MYHSPASSPSPPGAPARPRAPALATPGRVDPELVGVAGLIAAFTGVHAWLATTVDQGLDADGQVVRAVNRYASWRWGDAVFGTQVGLPSWAQPGHEIMATQSPYPPGYPVVMAPWVAVSGGDVAAIHLASLAWGVAGLVALAVAARALLGRWGALAAVGLLVGSPVVGGVVRAASIDTVAVAFVLAASAVALRSDGLARRGSGAWFGGLTALGLLVKWTVLVPLLPAWGVVAAGVAARSRRHAAAVVGEAAVGGGALLCILGGMRWGVPPAVTGAGPWFAAAVAAVGGLLAGRALNDPRLARLGAAVALVCGPGLAWYGASTGVLDAYLRGSENETEAVGLAQIAAYTGRFLSVGLWLGPLWVALGLVAARWTPRPWATAAFVAAGGLACALLVSTGSPWTFDGGVVATRQFQMFLPWVALGGGAAVVALPSRLRAAAAGLLAGVGLVAATSPAWSGCAPAPAEREVYSVCHVVPVPVWGATPLDRRAALPLTAAFAESGVVPATEAPRVTAVLVRAFRRFPPDEGEYLRGVMQLHRVFSLVDEPPRHAAGWIRRYAGRYDDLLLVGVTVEEAALAAAGVSGPGVAVPLGPGAPEGRFYAGPGRTIDVPTDP